MVGGFPNYVQLQQHRTGIGDVAVLNEMEC